LGSHPECQHGKGGRYSLRGGTETGFGRKRRARQRNIKEAAKRKNSTIKGIPSGSKFQQKKNTRGETLKGARLSLREKRSLAKEMNKQGEKIICYRGHNSNKSHDH